MSDIPRSAVQQKFRLLGIRQVRWIAVGMFAVSLCVTAAASGADTDNAHLSQKRLPDVLLITVDTLRPDGLGWVVAGDLGSESRNTPNIDALAALGRRFPAAFAPTPITLPSHTSMMTGLLPRRHGVRDNGQVVSLRLSTLAEQLRGKGYRTGAFVSGYPLAAEFGLDQGFATYDDSAGFRAEGIIGERRAVETTTAALDWLAGTEQGSADSPWFLWIHYFDPHDPYEPPAEHRQPGKHGAYYGEVASVDAAIGRLLKQARFLSSELLTVFAGDHGESLGEHGESTHGFFLYQSTMAVPIIVHFPGVVEPGVGKVPGTLVDLTPTVLDLLDLEGDGLDGKSLVAEMPSPRIAYLETRRPWYSYGWSPLRAVVEDGWKLIVAPRPELYDLNKDPQESVNKIETEGSRIQRLKVLLEEIESRPSADSVTSLDAETTARLESLGYVGAGSSPVSIPAQGLADPKDRIALWNRLGQAVAAQEAGQLTTALKAFDEVLAVEPSNPFALSRSGALLTSGIRDPKKIRLGINRLEKCVRITPSDAEAWRALAEAHVAISDWPEAADAWQEVVRLQPRRREAWIGLANALGLAGRPDRAVNAFDRLLELSPDDSEVRIRSAFAKVAAKDIAGAVKDFEVAARLNGEEFQHAGALGILLQQLGKDSEALIWLRRSLPSEGDYVAARIVLARLEVQAGRIEAARQALVDAIAIDVTVRDKVRQDATLADLLH
ncbi:MAG: sulfatase-like hydrolase/transferase [bacterium]|nr:sulfatase-like hydrolase/transferase [bacterium]